MFWFMSFCLLLIRFPTAIKKGKRTLCKCSHHTKCLTDFIIKKLITFPKLFTFIFVARANKQRSFEKSLQFTVCIFNRLFNLYGLDQKKRSKACGCLPYVQRKKQQKRAVMPSEKVPQLQATQ